VRRNTASEKVIRARSARGPTLLYDLRFRRNTVHCVAKCGFSARPPCVEDPAARARIRSVELTNRLFSASNSDILLILQATRGDGRAVGAKLSYYVFEVREEQDAAVQLHRPEAVFIIQALPII
jgi:hypothetical protein